MSEGGTLRLDEALVAAGLAPSRARARDMILRGTVTVSGQTETRPGRRVQPDAALAVSDAGARYVSRAALKLIAGARCLRVRPGRADGARSRRVDRRVYAGAARARRCACHRGRCRARAARCVARERSAHHAARRAERPRPLGPSIWRSGQIGAIVADLSFISLRLALPPALALAAPGAWGVFLVKPQFEVGREHLGKGGIVRDAERRRARQQRRSPAGWRADTGWQRRRPPPLAHPRRRRQPGVPARGAAWLRSSPSTRSAIAATASSAPATGAGYVPFTLPGERVAIERDGERARLIEVLEPSPGRVDAALPAFRNMRRLRAADDAARRDARASSATSWWPRSAARASSRTLPRRSASIRPADAAPCSLRCASAAG